MQSVGTVLYRLSARQRPLNNGVQPSARERACTPRLCAPRFFTFATSSGTLSPSIVYLQRVVDNGRSRRELHVGEIGRRVIRGFCVDDARRRRSGSSI